MIQSKVTAILKKHTHTELLKLRKSEEEIAKIERHPVSLMLHNVRSLYNVGSIFRTCDSGLANELILCGFTPHPPRNEIEKTALGAVDTVPWRYEKSIFKAMSAEKANGNNIVAVELTNNSRSYDSLPESDFPLSLILGNEITGIEDEILKECDMAVEIPMYGVKHSLNVSVAAGIVLFEAVRLWLNYKYTSKSKLSL